MEDVTKGYPVGAERALDTPADSGGRQEPQLDAPSRRRALWAPRSRRPRWRPTKTVGDQLFNFRRVSDELLLGDVDVDEDDGPAVRIVEERPPLREGKVFLDYGERATISENLEAAYVALNQAFG